MKNRRLTVLSSACGLLMLAGAPALAAPFNSSASPAKASPARGWSPTAPVRIATYNTQYGRSPSNVVSDIGGLGSAGADVIGLQEMGSRDRRKAVRSQLVECPSCVFDSFMSDLPERNATPILFRSAKFKLLDRGTRKVSNSTYVGRSGAGPARLKAKYVNWVLLRDRISRQKLYVLNNHAVPSVQGKGGRRNYSHPARLRLYRQHMTGLKSLITQFGKTGAAVFSTGDFNVNYRMDSIAQDKIFPYYNMSQVRVSASYKALGMPPLGTHGRHRDTSDGRLIDYVFFLRRAGVTPKSQSIMQGYGSDHRPVMVRFGLKKL